MKQKIFATLVTTVIAAIIGFAIGYLGSSGSIGGWIAFPKAAVGLLIATFVGLSTLFTSTLLSFAADQTSKTWWIYAGLSVVLTVFANILLGLLTQSTPVFSAEMVIPAIVVGVFNGLVYFFAERFAIKKSKPVFIGD
jgi:hypothetical protein